MLNPEREPSLQSQMPAIEFGESSPADTLASISATFRRQWRVLVVCLGLGFLAGALCLIYIKPGFLATATILIDTRKYPETTQTNLVARTTYESSAAIDTQVEILRSELIAKAVIDKLKLWDEPEFTQAGNGPRALLSKAMSFSHSPQLSLEERKSRATSYYLKHMIAKRVGDTFAIEVSFESKYADEAATIANTTAQAFIDWQRDQHRTAINEAGAWLEERITDLQAKSSAGQRSIAEYQAKNNVLSVGGDSSPNGRRLTDLMDQLETARAQQSDAQVKLSQLEQLKSGAQTLSDMEIFSTLSNVVNDPEINNLRNNYMDVTAKYADLSKKLPPGHEVLVAIHGQLQGMHTTLLGEADRVQLTVENAIQVAQAKVAKLQSDIAAAVDESRTSASTHATLKQLEVTASVYQSLYDDFLRRYADTLEAKKLPTAEASIISPADPPPLRNYKKMLVISALFPALGFLCAGGIVFFRERVTRPFWTEREVEQELRVPCSAIVPSIRITPDDMTLISDLDRQAVTTGGDSRYIDRRADALGWYAVAAPTTRFAESIRSIRLSLKLNGFESARGAIGLTSAVPNEGKTSLSLALATVSARSGSRVVLLDCDFRKPSLTETLVADSSKKGLLELLMGEARLEEVMLVDPVTRLHFIPTFRTRGQRPVADLLGGKRLEALVNQLKSVYDLVIIDLSPMSPIFDVAATKDFVDGYVLVVEWGQTQVQTVRYALQKMPQVHENAISVVLNKADLKRVRQYNINSQEFYSDRYNGRYGIT